MPKVGAKHLFGMTALCFSTPFALLACALLLAFLKAGAAYRALLSSDYSVACLFWRRGLDGLVEAFGLFALACAVVAALAAALSWVRREWALRAVRKCFFAFYLPALFLFLIVLKATSLLSAHAFEYAGVKVDMLNVFYWRLEWAWPLALLVVFAGLMHLAAWRRGVIDAYEGVDTCVEDEFDAPGDRFFENLRTHGEDPVYRRSKLASVFLHIFIMIILPWLLSLLNSIIPFQVPIGKGPSEITEHKVQVRPRITPRTLIVSPNSPISFEFPKIDELITELDEESRVPYEADNRQQRSGGNLGAGGEGGGGWPDGVPGGVVRFIRLRYCGADWNDGMDPVSRADMNFLEEFHRKTLRIFQTAREGEAHDMTLLRKYPKGFAPPFVYMTGSGGISTSGSEREALREYLLGGGMLFADCGSSAWNGNFRSFIRSIFPGQSLINIADDDPIYRQPYRFPNGAPPLWHHGGVRAQGVRHGNRLMVFYFPGDLNDAWKTGRSGLSPDKAEAAFDMGINVLYYAFTRYLEATRKHRK